jgi:hypothetical protein
MVCAAGSLPGDLHRFWRTSHPKQYHLEYGYSCMGYEIAGGLGVSLAAPSHEVYVMVGDGSYLMMANEIVTSMQEGMKLTIVLIDNHGFGSIGGLSEAVGCGGFGTSYRKRNPATGLLDGDWLAVDFARNLASLGAGVEVARDAASPAAWPSSAARAGDGVRTPSSFRSGPRRPHRPGYDSLVGCARGRGVGGGGGEVGARRLRGDPAEQAVAALTMEGGQRAGGQSIHARTRRR